uniref:DNA-directed RNA polymerase III subunit RPC6 n=1 Tax=Trichobilharzia regenti TaxID=157069 RepID=A0AA85JPJ9_TRIRE|nr:unnamed protein product [Trichobilharzia regenti]
MKEESSNFRERVLNLFKSSKGALTQKHFEKEFSDVSLTTILPILNALQKEGMLDVLVNADRTLSWQLRDQMSAEKLKSLSDLEERLVYNSIRNAGEDAASVKLISSETKLPQNRIPRILKSLISKKMIKELPMAVGHKQKVYLLMELEPSEKLAANTLFAGESGVDAEFISILRTACLKYLQDKAISSSHIADPLERRLASYVSCEEIHRFITNTKICTVAMSVHDVQCVLEALKFGGELETRLSSDNSDQSTSSGILYRLATQTPCAANLAHIPCTVCLCRKDCRPNGPINPQSCQLFQAFLEF